MKVLLDECVPKPLAKFLKDATISTAQDMGWASIKNGDLIALAEKNLTFSSLQTKT